MTYPSALGLPHRRGAFRQTTLPRTHFDTLPAALRTVFQLLTGARWRSARSPPPGSSLPAGAARLSVVSDRNATAARHRRR